MTPEPRITHKTPERRKTHPSKGFLEVLRRPFFLGLYVSEVQSVAGDQVARVALSVLAFSATGSALAAAGTYAATLLPALAGGFVVARAGDRFHRRSVMVVTDTTRALCFVVMALPAVPLGAVLGLLVFAVFIGPAFSAAEVSYLAERLSAQEYRAASALRLMSGQGAQVAGFAIGGALVAAIGPRLGLLIDAVTYVASASIVAWSLRSDRATNTATPATGLAVPVDAETSGQHTIATADDPVASFWRDGSMRALLGLTLLVGFFVVPEGLAVPVTHELGGRTWQVGVLLAAGALGGTLGSVALVRVVSPSVRRRVAMWMAVGCGLPLVVSGFAAQYVLVVVCWTASGALAAYVIETMTLVIEAMPAERRAHLVGIVNALLLGAQGIALLGFGAIAGTLGPGHSVGLAGALGSGLAVALMLLQLPAKRTGRHGLR